MRKLRESLNAEAIGVLRQARQATEQVWQRLAAHMPLARNRRQRRRTENAARLPSSSSTHGTTSLQRTKTVLDAYKHAYFESVRPPQEGLRIGIEEIKNRAEWGPLARQRIQKQHGRLAVVAAARTGRHR